MKYRLHSIIYMNIEHLNSGESLFWLSSGFSTGETKTNVKDTKLSSQPWDDVCVDFLGLLPSSDYIFALVDYYSRWIELAITISIMKSKTAEKTVEVLQKNFSTHGLSYSITIDNGPQFINAHFQEYCSVNGITHHRVTPLWP